jgi:hypothetical protein
LTIMNKHNRSRFLAAVAATFAAVAASAIPVGVTVNGTPLDSGGSYGAGWSYDPDSSTLSLFGTEPVTLSGANKSGGVRVVVLGGATNTVTLSNLTLRATGNDQCAFALRPNANVLLFLAGTNSLVSGMSRAGLEVAAGRTLSITNAPGDDAAALTAEGGGLSAGIGGGEGGVGGAVTINGGTVTATGSTGAGIGGGPRAAGIGGDGGKVTISGGTVTATGGGGGAGIGGGGAVFGGIGGAGGEVTISGGTVHATSDVGAGIGGGIGGAGGAVTISGGTVFAQGVDDGADIGPGGNGAASGYNLFTGGSIRLATSSPAPSNGVTRVGYATVSGFTPYELVEITPRGNLPGYYGTTSIYADGNGYIYLWFPDGDYNFTANGRTCTVKVKDGVGPTGVTVNGEEAAYGPAEPATAGWNFNATNRILSFSGAGPFTLAGANMIGGVRVVVSQGVTTAITLSNLTLRAASTNQCAFALGTNAYVLLFLAGTNTLSSGYNRAGLEVAAGRTLSITHASGDAMGSLTATGGIRGAGIGGGWNSSGGAVIVHGGIVKTYGGGGAGIGGGYQSADGTVTINGGTVTATGGSGGAGIGGGYQGVRSTVTINGGTVAATGVGGGTGIGGGAGGAGGAVTINGGTVTATGVAGGAGIGGDAGGVVTISGGTVTATGGFNGAGIGGRSDGTVTISGGTVTATGGYAGIAGGSGDVVTISGGTVTATGDAGIGGRYDGGTVMISGGTVTATGGGYGAGIGGGGDGIDGGAGGTVTISGGTVTATGGGGAGIGGGLGVSSGGAGGTVTISGGTVFAQGGIRSADIGPGGNQSGAPPVPGSNRFTGGTIRPANSFVGPTPSNGTARVACAVVTGFEPYAPVVIAGLPYGYGVNDIVADDVGYIYLWLPDSNVDYTFTANGRTCTVKVKDGVGPTGVTVNGEEVAYAPAGPVGWSFSPGRPHVVRFLDAGPFTLAGTDMIGGVCAVVSEGVTTAITLSNLTLRVAGTGRCAFKLERNACVSLFLAGTNTLVSGQYSSGIGVLVGRTLSITHAPGDAAGALTATGGYYGAGIGGRVEGGMVTINGGVVTATGGIGGAGIGGGGDGGTGGVVTVSGGIVTATGGIGGAGIGGGGATSDPLDLGFPGGSGGTITISGGTVTAIGGVGGAGIGGGGGSTRYSGGGGGTVAISGGTVFAQGTSGGADIGPGDDGTASGSNTFTGGSIRLANDTIAPAPRNGWDRVWCVTVPDLTPGAAVVLTGLAAHGYGVNDLFADDSGKLYLWLPNNDYGFMAGGIGYTATVAGAAATAVGFDAPAFATDGTALVFDGTLLTIKITNAKSGVWYTLYTADTLGGDWEMRRIVKAEADGDLVFENISATVPRRFFKVAASFDPL